MTRTVSRPALLLCNTRVAAPGLQVRLGHAGIREWIGLVPEYEVLAELEGALAGVTRVKIGAELQIAANVLRRPYLTLIADFGKRFASLAWWASSVAERNTNGSDLFLHCCYLRLVDRYFASGKSVCIVCDSRALRAAIAERARHHGYRIREYGTGRPRLHETAAGAAAVIGRNVVTVFLRWVVVRLAGGGGRRSTAPAAPPDVLLRTWVDPESIDRSGLLRDRYLPGLAAYYASKGITSATILVIFENLRTFAAMVRRVRGIPEYILPEAYLRPSDLLFPVALWLRRRRFVLRPAVLCGMDVSRLFGAANRAEPMSVMASLHYPLMRRLAARGFRPRVFVLPFENMIVDKMTILGVRRYMPGTRVYGFCHNPIKRNVLPWYTDAHERDIAPLPDKIICNGQRYREILIREHYPPERVVVGAALRYAYLHGGARSPAPARRSSAGGVVLLVLTTKRDGTLEVIEKFLAAVRGWDAITILVKPHPFARGLADRVTAVLGPRAEIITGAMPDALARCDVMVSTASGAVLEAALAGKPVITVAPEAQLDMDPLAWFDGFPQPVGTAEELRRRLEEALSRTTGVVAAANNGGLDGYFAPPTDEHMAAFLPEGLPAGAPI